MAFKVSLIDNSYYTCTYYLDVLFFLVKEDVFHFEIPERNHKLYKNVDSNADDHVDNVHIMITQTKLLL